MDRTAPMLFKRTGHLGLFNLRNDIENNLGLPPLGPTNNKRKIEKTEQNTNAQPVTAKSDPPAQDAQDQEKPDTPAPVQPSVVDTPADHQNLQSNTPQPVLDTPTPVLIPSPIATPTYTQTAQPSEVIAPTVPDNSSLPVLPDNSTLPSITSTNMVSNTTTPETKVAPKSGGKAPATVYNAKAQQDATHVSRPVIICASIAGALVIFSIIFFFLYRKYNGAGKNDKSNADLEGSNIPSFMKSYYSPSNSENALSQEESQSVNMFNNHRGSSSAFYDGTQSSDISQLPTFSRYTSRIMGTMNSRVSSKSRVSVISDKSLNRAIASEFGESIFSEQSGSEQSVFVDQSIVSSEYTLNTMTPMFNVNQTSVYSESSVAPSNYSDMLDEISVQFSQYDRF